MSRVFNFFRRDQQEKSDFSSFFRYASSSEKSKLLRKVAREANEEQKELIERYHRKSHQTAS